MTEYIDVVAFISNLSTSFFNLMIKLFFRCANPEIENIITLLTGQPKIILLTVYTTKNIVTFALQK